MNLQRTVNSVLTVCLSLGDNPTVRAKDKAARDSQWVEPRCSAEECHCHEDLESKVPGPADKTSCRRKQGGLWKYRWKETVTIGGQTVTVTNHSEGKVNLKKYRWTSECMPNNVSVR